MYFELYRLTTDKIKKLNETVNPYHQITKS